MSLVKNNLINNNRRLLKITVLIIININKCVIIANNVVLTRKNITHALRKSQAKRVNNYYIDQTSLPTINNNRSM